MGAQHPTLRANAKWRESITPTRRRNQRVGVYQLKATKLAKVSDSIIPAHKAHAKACESITPTRRVTPKHGSSTPTRGAKPKLWIESLELKSPSSSDLVTTRASITPTQGEAGGKALGVHHPKRKRGSPSPQLNKLRHNREVRHCNSRPHVKVWEAITQNLGVAPNCVRPSPQIDRPC